MNEFSGNTISTGKGPLNKRNASGQERKLANGGLTCAMRKENEPAEDGVSTRFSLEEIGRFELTRLLKGDVPSSPQTTIFGLSPPTRSGHYGGACNPLTFDQNWHLQARSAVHRNLQALRERDLQGGSFLNSTSIGNPRLLVGSPECCFLKHVVKESTEQATDQEGQVPFACHTRYYSGY